LRGPAWQKLYNFQYDEMLAIWVISIVFTGLFGCLGTGFT
jgi:hypothetical protein